MLTLSHLYLTKDCQSKWAVEGFTEALSHELKPEWNIHLSCIEPGGFRRGCHLVLESS